MGLTQNSDHEQQIPWSNGVKWFAHPSLLPLSSPAAKRRCVMRLRRKLRLCRTPPIWYLVRVGVRVRVRVRGRVRVRVRVRVGR